jgi:DNA-binding transcriptional LysR family regulator
MIVPTHASAVNVVATSDLVGTVLASLAERAAGGPQRLQAFDLPFDTSVIAIAQAWHPRLDGDPTHRWLRAKVRQVCRRPRNVEPKQIKSG